MHINKYCLLCLLTEWLCALCVIYVSCSCSSQEKSTADQRIEDDSISDRNKAISVTSTPVVNGPADIQVLFPSL